MTYIITLGLNHTENRDDAAEHVDGTVWAKSIVLYSSYFDGGDLPKNPEDLGSTDLGVGDREDQGGENCSDFTAGS